MSADIEFRRAETGDIPALKDLIFQHGVSEWNHLPPDEVNEHLDQIATGVTGAVVACIGGMIVGMVTHNVGSFYPQYELPEDRDRPHGYLAEAVVRQDQAGKGIGTELFRRAALELLSGAVISVYSKRHEQNDASRRMMEKSGFIAIDTFHDPDVRPSGTRNTTINRLRKSDLDTKK